MNENQFVTELDNIIKQRIGEVHTACPATIVNFNPSTCIATVQPSLKYYSTDGSVESAPVVTGVPVLMPHAGNSQITYPVKTGDGCIIIFCERSLDEWIGKGSDDEHDPRKFDMTDAMAIVGMRPTQSISADNVELINEGTLISVTPNNTINIIGNINVQGTITCTGDVIGGGISLIGHTHPYHHGSTGPSQ